MIYALLGALAFLFFLLGFLLHAIYSHSSVKQKLAAERTKLQKKIDEKQAESDWARDEIARKNVLLRDLEQMIGKRNGEIEALQSMALRQEEEINLLRQDAAAIRQAVMESEVAVSSHQSVATGHMRDAGETRIQQPLPQQNQKPLDGRDLSDARNHHGASGGNRVEVHGARSGRSSAWRENLSEILKSIDSVEEKKEE
jgi:hypothetical protein